MGPSRPRSRGETGRRAAEVRVLLADDHPVVRRGLRAVLEQAPEITVTAEAADGVAALRLALIGDVDLAVLDVVMPRMSGLRVAAEMSRRCPEVRVLMLSLYDDDRYVQEAVAAGACGYVLKTAGESALIDACRGAIRGEPFLYPSGARQEPALNEALTARESEIVKLIADGRTNEQIADLLVISRRTVDHHVANILAKLGLHNRVELTRHAIRIGLVEP